MARPATPLAARFWPKVTVGGLFDCWEWQGCRSPQGYGVMRHQGHNLKAHRAAFICAYGDAALDSSRCVLHACDNPRCVNPSHLFLGTVTDNNADCTSKGRRPHGEGHVGAKLTAAQIPLIRQRLAAGDTPRRIGEQFGVTGAAISCIRLGKNWRHITETV